MGLWLCGFRSGSLEFLGAGRKWGGRLGLLAAEIVIPLGGFEFQILFAAAFTLSGAGAQNEEKIAIVALDAVVAAHGEAEKQQPKEVASLPAGWANVGGIAESTVHRWLVKKPV